MPSEVSKLRDGHWTQRFQAAIFKYHPENDVYEFFPGTAIQRRTYRVQLALLGDTYIQAHGLPFHYVRNEPE